MRASTTIGQGQREKKETGEPDDAKVSRPVRGGLGEKAGMTSLAAYPTASGIRDTARVLRISTDTVLSELKKKEALLASVNTALLRTLNPEQIVVDIEQAGEAEIDEMWSFVGNKGHPRWLWHAIDHHTGQVLAYVFGRRQDTVFLKLKALLEPFGITRYYTDYWGAYTRHLDAAVRSPGKRNTQQIERKHLTLRTRIKRLVRKTICFSKTIQRHDIVIGL